MKKKFIFAVLVILAFGLSIGCAMSSKEDYTLSMKEVLSSKENIEFVSKSIESTFVKAAMYEKSDNDKYQGYMETSWGEYCYHYPTSVYGDDVENKNNMFQYPNIQTTFIMADIKNVYNYQGYCYKANININGKNLYIKDVNNRPILFDENDEKVFMQPFGYAKMWIYKNKNATLEREAGIGVINFYKINISGKYYYIALAEYYYDILGFRVWIGDLY